MKVKEYDIEPGANLSGANLRGADLRGAKLDGANLRGAKLDGAIFYPGWVITAAPREE